MNMHNIYVYKGICQRIKFGYISQQEQKQKNPRDKKYVTKRWLGGSED